MINFICEFFDCQPANMRIAYLRQRLLVMIFREVLFEKGIASASLSSMKIHFALNLEDKGTPDDVETIGLFDIKDKNGNQIFNKDNLTELVNDVAGRYIDELETIEKDISKTNLL